MENAAERRLNELMDSMRNEFASFRIISKRESRFQKVIHYCLMAVTGGQMRFYLTRYHTTLGQTVYVSDRWNSLSTDEKYILLVHERIHMRQFRQYTFVGMALLYLFVPLPMGLAYFRSRFEKQAYEQTLYATARVYGKEKVHDPKLRQYILSQFTGPAYAWMWPFPRLLNRWYDGVLATISTSGSS